MCTLMCCAATAPCRRRRDRRAPVGRACRGDRVVSLIEWSVGSWRLTLERTLAAPTALGRAYDRAAWRWDASVCALGYRRAYARLFECLAQDDWLRDLRTGARVLDAGIGTAALSAALVSALAQAPEVDGVDLSSRMLRRARATLERLRRSQLVVRMHCGDVNRMPYPDEGLDMVMSAHLLEHSATPAETIEEMTRVLRVGAPLLIVTSRATAMNALHGMRWRYRAIAPEQLCEWLDRAGLHDVRRYPLGRRWSLPGQSSEAYIGRKGRARSLPSARDASGRR